ncbi:MAG TPA: MFS transporter [Steroidobacteraceae bacterium]|jgi:MFS family permease|nr:MFS transporter [Steroidobacteraceae bacterium]
MASTTPAAETPPPRISSWSAFRHPTFRIVWVATVVSNVGGWVSSTASGWLMTSLNPDPLAVSLVQVMSNLPLFILALPAGALVDMVDQRRLLIVAELATMAASAVFAILVSTHLITPTSLLVMTALTSAAVAVSLPAWQTVVSQLVPKPELPAAVALDSVGINISRAVGPALGGFLVSAFGFGPPFWVDAFSNAGVLAALFRWRRPARAAASLPRERIGSALRVGLRHARYNPHLSATLIRAGTFFASASAYWALLPLATLRQASGGATLYGGLLGMIGAGAVAGALVLPRLKERLGADRLMAVCAAGTAVAMALFGVARGPGTFVLASALAGMSWIGAVSSLNISAQVALPEWVRGRGLAVFVTVMFGGLSLGGLLWGEVAALDGTSGALLAAAAVAALTIPITWRWKLQTGAGVDFTPSQPWPAPITTHEVEKDRGPVMATVEYRVAPENRARFIKAMYRYSRARRRDGAYDWRLFEDPAEDGKFVETFMSDSWLEHLRLHARVSKADRLQEAIVQRLLIGNSYKTTHLIEVDGGPVHEYGST